MKIGAEALILDLKNRTQELIDQAESLKNKSEETLNFKVDPTSWSILECLEHLNLYGRFYLPEIAKQIKASNRETETEFKSGVLGNYFANSMLPKEKLNKMKTFQNMNPINSKLDKTVIHEFVNQQTEMLQLLELARKISLNKTKTSISISKLLKLKLGDTFRFVIYHNQRHMVQALRLRSVTLHDV
jgi:hypothetical protein